MDCRILFSRRELQAAQSENFQLEKKIHELQMSIQNPHMANRLSDLANGPPSGFNAPSTTTPDVVRKYHEMKYGNKTPNNPPPLLSMHNNSTASFEANSLPMRNGILPGSKGPSSSVPQPNVTVGARNSTFKFPTKLPDSIQTTISNTSQSLQSKLPASLQKLPASFTQGPTINMLANKLQNAFS